MKSLFKLSNLIVGFVILSILAYIIYTLTPSNIVEQSQSNVTKIYFADNISSAHQKLIDRFNRHYQGQIEVVPLNLPFTKFSTNERKELLARTLRSKSSRIDVFSVDIIWVPRFARWGFPLDDYFPQAERNSILNDALKSCFHDGQLMAMPFYTDIGMMYYRQDIIGTLPDRAEIERKISESITWEDFIKLSQRFSRAPNPFYLFPADNYEGFICSFVEGIASQNQTLLAGNSIQIDTPEARKTLQMLVDLIHKYQATPAIVSKYDEFQCYLHALKEDGLFLRGWPGFLRHYRNEMVDTSKFKFLKMAPLPHFRNGRPAYVFGGWNLMVPRHSTKKDEAIEFIKFTQRPESQKMMFQEGGYLPIIYSLYSDSSFLRQEPDLKFYSRLLEFGIHRPYLVDYTKISDIITNYLNMAIKNELSVAEALHQASSLINNLQYTGLAK